LLKESRQGKKVLVATVFSRATKYLPYRGKDFYAFRRYEDEQALSILGISNPLWLDFPDAPFRNLFYTSFRTIMVGEHAKDRSYVDKIAETVANLCEQYAPETIFVPLAIGTHVDHRLTHHIWCDLPTSADIIFYEDRPYVFLPYSLELRLKEIRAEALQPTAPGSLFENSDYLRSFAEGLEGISLYKKALWWKRERFRYILWAARKFKLPPQEPNLKIAPEIIATNEITDVTQIVKAIAAYRSQMFMLYKNMEIFRRESASYIRTFDATSLYAERYWKLVR
jgi:LmbE family N-acetylglucosaminyl deacetylase